MKHICVVGSGYVGLVTGACFAKLGHEVACVDIDEARVASLRRGVVPIYEPGLQSLVHDNLQNGRLQFYASLQKGIRNADFVFMCVGTPATQDNNSNLTYVYKAYLTLAEMELGRQTIVVNKSTVPPGTADTMASILARIRNGRQAPPVVSNPEFLREGHACSDFMKPTRVVIGASEQAAASAVAELFQFTDAPFLFTDRSTAEMIKLVSNAFLATKVSFINEIATLCEKIGVDVEPVAKGIGLDPRIGDDYLRAGIGYGGSCLPKDIAVLNKLIVLKSHESKLLSAVIETNAAQPGRLVQRIKDALGAIQGKSIAVLGLTFKQDTDDLRKSPAIALIAELQTQGARVHLFDPKVNCPANLFDAPVLQADSPYAAAQGCDATVIATEWADFKALDLYHLKRIMSGSVLADGRNIIDIEKARAAGFRYIGVGRQSPGPSIKEELAPVAARVD